MKAAYSFGVSPAQASINLDELFKSINAFCALCDEPAKVPMHYFLLFLEVARLRGHCTYRQLENVLGLANSSVSRTVNALGAEYRNGKPGLGLLTTFKDPDEGRRLIVTFTPKGLAFLRQFQAV